jgi:hypothetical protein
VQLQPPATQHSATPSCPSGPHTDWMHQVLGGTSRPGSSWTGSHTEHAPFQRG